jgi:hypothetical protein
MRADKELVHLTYARLDVTPEGQAWRHPEISGEISARMEAFLKLVNAQLLHSCWAGPGNSSPGVEGSYGGVTGVSTQNVGPFYGGT